MGTETVYDPRSVKRKRRTNAELAEVDDAIVAAVAADSPVTLRGVFYRVVSAGAIEKTESGYNVIKRRLLKLRRAHVIPYANITDGTRWVIRPTTFQGIEDALDAMSASYRRALWEAQDHEVHIFTEKDAISGVIASETKKWDVPLGVVRGYVSETFAYEMAESINEALTAGKQVHVYQLGDHDPSGVDGWRDFQSKVTNFVSEEFAGDIGDVEFERLAVTEDQIIEWGLPTRPTKASDTRARGFRGESVEVDAIPANVLRELVGNAITQHIDWHQLEITQIAEQAEREGLARLGSNRLGQ